MALIVCKCCGGKISDTVETCIHCGASIKESPIVHEEPIDKESSLNNQAPSSESKRFEYLSEEVQQGLQRDFLQSDTWARKYMQKNMEIASFSKNVLIYFFLFTISRSLIADMPVSNENFFNFGLCAVLVLLVIGVCLLFYAIGFYIYSFATLAKYIYLKKFQIWLQKEKNIDFVPTFKRDRQLRKFESINLE